MPMMLPLAGLPPHHRDPFDRIIVAQAIQHGLMVATVDPDVAAYPIQLIPTA
jgi:PIN domain nuclease of toxin-antitoxin system